MKAVVMSASRMAMTTASTPAGFAAAVQGAASAQSAAVAPTASVPCSTLSCTPAGFAAGAGLPAVIAPVGPEPFSSAARPSGAAAAAPWSAAPLESASPPLAAAALRELIPDTVRLVLIRGLPGSGKSTLARSLAAGLGYVHLEADQYFARDGGYSFDPARLADAHAWCQRTAFEHLAGEAKVAIANTFVTLWELSCCIGLAQTLALPYRIFEARGSWANVHAVPAEVVAQMRARWEPLPAHLEPLAGAWPR